MRISVILGLALSEADDQGSHGHFDVEFDHVDNGMELNVDHWVLEEHETNEKALLMLAKAMASGKDSLLTSMAIETIMSFALKLTSGLYLVRPT